MGPAPQRPGEAYGLAYSVAVNCAGKLFVTGQSAGATTGSDYATIGYAG